MSLFVLDCSVTAAWLFADEASPRTDALLQRLTEGVAAKPVTGEAICKATQAASTHLAQTELAPP